MKKIIAAIMAICCVCGGISAVQASTEGFALTAGAVDIYTEVVEGDLTFHVYDDFAELIKCSTGAEGEVVIPEKIKGKPVDRIGESAFSGCKGITYVTIPESVSVIEMNAFRNCTALTGFSRGLPLFHGSSIAGCTALKSLSLTRPMQNGMLTALDISDCRQLEGLEISEDCILESQFRLGGCPLLKNLKLPETTALSSIVVTDCASLTEIQLPLKNQVDNAVFSISKCGKIKELDLSSADISSVNIESMSGLEKVSFNSEKKPKYSMNDCEKLTAVTRFLASDSTIDYETCPELKDVYYYEETSERPQIHDVMKLALYGVTVHCRKSNTELISCLRKYSVDIAFIGETKLKGDANCDDEVNLADAVFIMQTVSAPDKYKLSERGAENADVDASGDITNMDALLIQRYKLGIIDEL